jgi:hypothetical protein
MCAMHGNRVRRHGSPSVVLRPGRARTQEELLAWILENTDTPKEGCWSSRIKLRTSGYPTVNFQGKPKRVHRLLHEWINVEDPVTAEKPMVLHWCDNANCYRPSHLRAGTAQENVDDARRNGTYRPFNRYTKPV